MAGELVKWNGGQMVKAKSPEEKLRAIADALALFKAAPVSVARSRGSAAVVPANAGLIVDLPRICAVHDRPYAARYVRGVDGIFRRGPMIEVTESIWLRQYAGNGARRLIVPSEQVVVSQEVCPWCGASGFSAILCGKCRLEICYGRTAGSYFCCRLSCGRQGNIRWIPRASEGVTPGETRGGGYGV